MAVSEQKLRILKVADLLLERTDEEHTLSVPEMIAHLKKQGIHAERRAIYDDLETLAQAGMDILSKRGKTYGYYVASRNFELAELKLLVDAIQSSRFLTHKKSSALIHKLEGLTSVYEAKSLNRQVYVTNRVKTMNESIYYNVDEIHRAILMDRQISFLYYEYTLDKKLVPRRGGEIYQVSPYVLSYDDENYYLVAYHPRYQGLSHFRVDKMGKIQILEEPRKELDGALDAAEYAKHTFGMFQGEKRRVEVEFSNALIGVVIDRFSKKVFLQPSGEGKFLAHLDVAVSPAFFSWIFQFQDQARIIGPEDVKRQMQEQIKRVSAQY